MFKRETQKKKKERETLGRKGDRIVTWKYLNNLRKNDFHYQ